MPPRGVSWTKGAIERRSAAIASKPLPARKRCPQCAKTKRRAAFGTRSKNRRWLRARCLKCESVNSRQWHRDNREKASRSFRRFLLRRYGLTEDDYDAMVAAQGGLCAVCDRAPRGIPRLVVDHCHVEGGVRALLCSPCNRGIGLLGDSPAMLRAAADYIERHKRKDAA